MRGPRKSTNFSLPLEPFEECVHRLFLLLSRSILCIFCWTHNILSYCIFFMPYTNASQHRTPNEPRQMFTNLWLKAQTFLSHILSLLRWDSSSSNGTQLADGDRRFLQPHSLTRSNNAERSKYIPRRITEKCWVLNWTTDTPALGTPRTLSGFTAYIPSSARLSNVVSAPLKCIANSFFFTDGMQWLEKFAKIVSFVFFANNNVRFALYHFLSLRQW